MKVNTYDFIWSCFSASDIENVLADMEMVNSQQKFLFVVDTYDVVENYLPYTEIELFAKGDTNQLAQKYICYDYLFDRSNTTYLLLPDEYKIELLAVKNKLQRHLKEATAVISNLRKLRDETPDFADYEKTSQFFRKNFEIILLLLIINNKEGKILDDFRNFVRERLQISDIVVDEPDHEAVNNIFRNTGTSKLSVEIFKEWVNANKLFLISIDDDSHRHVFLENTFRDIQVIERMMKVNKAFRDQSLKYTAIYLSTANKTSALFQLISSKINVLEPGATYNLNFHRNVFQYFLHKKLSTDYKNNITTSLSILTSLRKSRERLENLKDEQMDTIDKYALNTVQKMFEDASSDLDNHFYLSIYKKYKSAFSLSVAQPDKGLLDGEELQRILTEIDNNAELSTEISHLSFSLTQVNQSLEAIGILGGLERRVSKDLIRNTYQHLPVLLFQHDDRLEEMTSHLYDFINSMIESSKETKENRLKGVNNMSLMLSKILAATSNPLTSREKLVRSIIVSYITLFASNKVDDEDQLINDFNTQLELINALTLQVDTTESANSSSIKFTSKQNSLTLEVCYILLWLYRRNKREDDGIQLGETLLKNHADDPRVCQGLGLCYLVKAYANMKVLPVEEVLPVFRQSELCLIDAEKFLSRQLEDGKFRSESKRQLIIKSQTAVLNSIANIKIRLFELGGQKDPLLISEGLHVMSRIRNMFEKNKLDYEKHATYLGTEIELLFFEASLFKMQSQLPKARASITSASILFTKLKELNDYKYAGDFFKEKFKMLPGLMTELMLTR